MNAQTCSAPAGSWQRVETYLQRAERGLPIFNAGDNRTLTNTKVNSREKLAAIEAAQKSLQCHVFNPITSKAS